MATGVEHLWDKLEFAVNHDILIGRNTGATSFRPSEKPSIRCGSMKPKEIRKSADTSLSSISTGVPVEVVPRKRCSARFRAS